MKLLEVFDRDIAFQHAKGDAEVVKKRCESFSQSAEASLGSFEQALETKDVASLRRLADELRTASIEVGASGIENLIAQFLEAMDASKWKEMNALLTKLLMELGWFQRIIDERACSGNL